MTDISPTSAHVFGYLTRQEFIEVQARVEARRKEFLCHANVEQAATPCRCCAAVQSTASEDAE